MSKKLTKKQAQALETAKTAVNCFFAEFSKQDVSEQYKAFRDPAYIRARKIMEGFARGDALAIIGKLQYSSSKGDPTEIEVFAWRSALLKATAKKGTQFQQYMSFKINPAQRAAQTRKKFPQEPPLSLNLMQEYPEMVARALREFLDFPHLRVMGRFSDEGDYYRSDEAEISIQFLHPDAPPES